MQIIHLPYPPPSNHLYPTSGGRRHKSKEYTAWIGEAGWSIIEQGFYSKPTIKGMVEIIIHVFKPDKRKRDVANLEKAVADLLVAHKVIEDDSLIESNSQVWRHDGPEGVVVYIKAWDEGEHFVRIPE